MWVHITIQQILGHVVSLFHILILNQLKEICHMVKSIMLQVSVVTVVEFLMSQVKFNRFIYAKVAGARSGPCNRSYCEAGI